MRLLVSGVAMFLVFASPARSLAANHFASEIASYAKATNFSGVILVSEGDHVRYRSAFGEADRGFGVKMRDDTTFRIASVTKLFTAAVVLDLVEEGAVRLDDSIAAYLPEYPGDGAGKISVRQLLTHTSGLPQFDTVGSYQEGFERGIPHYQRPLSASQLLILCCNGAPARPSGASFEYNNADYIVLGRIIERVTGKSFGAALSERIIAPLHLDHTGMMSWDHPPKELASTYFFREDTGQLVNDMPFYWENCYAAGGMYSTADDLRVFADALFGGRLFDGKLLAEMLKPGLDEYGLGLWSYSFRAAGRTWRVAKRPGSIMGANAVLYRLIDLDATIILLANTNKTDLDEFAQEIAERFIDRRSRTN